MGIGASILLITVGAILRWAVTANVDAISLDTLGLILMLVGAVGLVVSVMLWAPWPRRRVRRVQVVDDKGRSYERVERVSDSVM
jgi:cell division septal protein FtsQ